MTKDQAIYLAQELSVRKQTVAISFVEYIYRNYDCEYDVCLESAYMGEDDDVVARFDNGTLL